MKSIGIDQSLTSTGVCVYDSLSQEVSFEIIPTKVDKSDELSVYRRVSEISNRIRKIVDEAKPDIIVIEGLAMGGVPGNSARNLAGLQFTIVDKILEREDNDTSLKIVPPTTLKKFATGKGNAKKEQMFEALPEEMQEVLIGTPKTKGRFDLTDAYFLSKWGVEK